MRFSRLRSCVAVATFAASSLALVAPSIASASDEVESRPDTQQALEVLRSTALAPTGGMRTEGNASTPRRIEAIQTVSDVLGDSLWLQGDITSAGVNASASGMVAVAVGVAAFDSPFSSSWFYGITGPVWSIDANNDLVADFAVAMVNANGVVVAGVMTADAEVLLCEAVPSWDSVNRIYGATFPAACIGNPSMFHWQSSFLYEEYFSGVPSFDAAPYPGWAGPVVNDGALPVPPPPPSTAGFTSVLPARLLETRPGLSTVDGRFNGVGSVAAGSTTSLAVNGRGGVPVDASAVVLNVTAVSPRSAGYLTIFPCGSGRPNASSVNFIAGQTVPNAVVAKVGQSGSVCIYSQSAVDLIVDVNGYFVGETAYSSLNPGRLLETRPGLATVDGQFNGIGARTAGTTLELVVAGRGGVPADASSAVLNVTAVDARDGGFLTVYPCGSAQPNASSVNFAAGQTVANAVVTKIGAGGKVCVFTQATTDLLIDVNGWFGAASPFGSVVPARLVETRSGLATVDGIDNGGGLRGGGTITSVLVAGRGGVPVGASTVVLNVTVTGPYGAGFVTVFPCGSVPPNASNLNFTPGQTVPNAVVSKVGPDGRVCVYTQATTHLIVDVNGYFM